MGYFNSKGQRIHLHKVGETPNVGSSFIESDIQQAVERCRNGASAKTEIAKAMRKHPILKTDGNWDKETHPLSPLITEFVRQVFQ